MYSVTKTFEFEAAHRLMKHGGKCKHLHGHSYRAVITVEGDDLDKCGMVVDFADVSKVAKEWIDKNWDHNTILNSLDPLVPYLNNTDDNNKAPYEMACEPTAENLARKLWQVMAEALNVIAIRRVRSVTIFETSTSYATYTHDYDEYSGG